MTDLASATPVAFVQVTDRDRGIAFYRDTLGMAHESADDFGDFFTFGRARMRLTALPDWKPSGHPMIGWDVDDIDAAVAALMAKGIVMTIYDGMGQDENGIWTPPDGRAKVAFFNDPDGNCLSLAQH
jgi:catechol 2,3-dioxygenase-like lactoylglutathione lyase family enzyme